MILFRFDLLFFFLLLDVFLFSSFFLFFLWICLHIQQKTNRKKWNRKFHTLYCLIFYWRFWFWIFSLKNVTFPHHLLFLQHYEQKKKSKLIKPCSFQLCIISCSFFPPFYFSVTRFVNSKWNFVIFHWWLKAITTLLCIFFKLLKCFICFVRLLLLVFCSESNVHFSRF